MGETKVANCKKINENLAKLGLDFCNYTDEELEANIPKSIRVSAEYMLDSAFSYHALPRALRTQTAVLMIQNELTHRQNEKIIQQNEQIITLLQDIASK